MAGLGKPTAAVLRYLLARPNIDILSELEYDDPHLMDLHEDFRRASSGHPLKTVNFFEQKPTQYFPFYRILVCARSKVPKNARRPTNQDTDRPGVFRYFRGCERQLTSSR